MLFLDGCDTLFHIIFTLFLRASNTLVSESCRHFPALSLQVRKSFFLAFFTFIFALLLDGGNYNDFGFFTLLLRDIALQIL